MQRLALFRKLEFRATQADRGLLDRSASYFRATSRRVNAAISWRTPEGARCSTTVHHDLEIYRDLGFIDREVPRAGQA